MGGEEYRNSLGEGGVSIVVEGGVRYCNSFGEKAW